MNNKNIFLAIIILSMPTMTLVQAQDNNTSISHYTCGMHPSIKVSSNSYREGNDQCPICFMPLTSVQLNINLNDTTNTNVISKVSIKLSELKLAGVRTEVIKKRSLFKEIRAVGKVAYDPQMAIAQDEFISSIKNYEESKKGAIKEIIERSQSLVESSKRKLLLLGLNNNQIEDLKITKKIQSNLILPDNKMWIYGDVYDYQLEWIKINSPVKVSPISLSGEEFFGKIISINPVFNPRTRSVRFRALIDNPNHKLKPEMYTDIEIISEYTDPHGNNKVLAIPKNALLDTGRRRIVWVDKGNGHFEGRSVKIGPEAVNRDNSLKYYPVFKGLKDGERVVTKGNFLIDSQSQITGIVSSYGGHLNTKSDKSVTSVTHNH